MKKGDENRHVIVFPSGHKEVWVVPGSEEWRERRGRGRGGGVGDERGEEKDKKNETTSEASYSEPEEEVDKYAKTFIFMPKFGQVTFLHFRPSYQKFNRSI